MTALTANDPKCLSADRRRVSVSRQDVHVTQICTTAVRGGAARAAYRLHRALAGEEGVHSQMLVGQKLGPDDGTLEYNPLAPAPAFLGRLFFRLCRRWHRPSLRKAGAYFTLDRTPVGWRLASQLPAGDLVHLHWVADLFDYRTLPPLTSRLPVVWTFHDMNAFTGGYAWRCGACPQLKNSSGENDITRRVMDRKLRVFAHVSSARLAIVCPSRWLAGTVKHSLLCRNFDTRVIPNGIDTGEFYPVEQGEARRQLDLPARARIVLFVAENLTNRRKGFHLLLEAIEGLRNIPGLLLVTLGGSDTALLKGPHFRHLGPLHDGEKLRAAYSAADVFATPALQDNLPNTVIESMACGTPVAGFDAGGIGEAVVDGQTGLLAREASAASLAGLLRRVLEDRRLRQSLALESRLRVEREYNIRLQAQRYAALYREVLQRVPVHISNPPRT